MVENQLNKAGAVEIGEKQSTSIVTAVGTELTQNLDADTKLQLISKIYTALGAEFKHPYTINKEQKGKNGEYTKISVVNPDVPQRSEPEISMTIQPNGNVILRINPYNHYEDFYFISKQITPDELLGELRKIKDILATGKIQGHSLLEEKSLDRNNY